MNNIILIIHLVSGLTIQVTDQWEIQRIQEYVILDQSHKFIKVSNMRINMDHVEFIEEKVVPLLKGKDDAL